MVEKSIFCGKIVKRIALSHEMAGFFFTNLELENACMLKGTQIYYLISSHRVKIGDGPSHSSLPNFSS